MKAKIILFLGLMLATTGLMAHPIKMTTSKISYDKKTGELVLLINFFIDDFGAHLGKIYHQRNVNLENSGDTEKSMVNAYVSRKVLLKLNHKASLLKLSALNKIDENVVQATFRLPCKNLSDLKLLEVSNALLFDAFPEQVNVLHFDLPAKIESSVYQFTPSESYKAITLSN